MHKRPLAIIALLFISGIALARFLPFAVKFRYIFIATSVLILFSFVFSRHNKPASIFLFSAIVLFSAALYVNSNTFADNHISCFLGEERLKASITGVIKSPVLSRRPYYGKVNSTYLFEFEAIKGDDEESIVHDKDNWLKVSGLAQIRIETEKEYKYGDRLFMEGTIKRPRGTDPRSRNKFDYRAYLERQNIFALISTKENSITVLSRNYKSNPILRYIYLVRAKLKNQIIEKMPLDTGAFLRAILLGDRSELPKKLNESFRNSGTMHMLAISGLHVGLIALIIIYLLRLLRTGRVFSYVFTIVFLVFFSILTLSRPSVERAVIMASILLVGMLLGRRVDIYNSMGVAAIFILAKNPKELFSVGFQLSFVAVLSIVYFAPKFMRLVKKDVYHCVKKYIFMPLAVSVSACFGTFPLILYYFKMIAPIAIIANLFIIPALFALLIGGVAFLALGWVPFIGTFLAGLNNILAQAIFSLADFFSSLEYGHFLIN